MNIEDPKWFNENFFDVDKHKPQKGQVLSRFRAVAHFVDDWVKQNVVDAILNSPVGAEDAVRVINKLCKATYEDAVNVSKEIAQDLTDGMTREEVLKKEYRMIIEYFFYTLPENVPEDSINWSKIELIKTN